MRKLELLLQISSSIVAENKYHIIFIFAALVYAKEIFEYFFFIWKSFFNNSITLSASTKENHTF